MDLLSSMEHRYLVVSQINLQGAKKRARMRARFSFDSVVFS